MSKEEHWICSAPGKVMLAGEYAVIDGHAAVMLAVDRFAVATLRTDLQHLSPFLEAARHVIEAEFGAKSEEAYRAARVRVDTSAFRQGEEKLGLGSSAAATVAAVGLALGPAGTSKAVHRIARQAHGDAQEPKGARGSGADVASSSFGGCLRFTTTEGAPTIAEIALPKGLHLAFPWCGQSASTTSLVSQVRPLRSRDPKGYEELTNAIATAGAQLAQADGPAEAVAAVAEAGEAVRALGEAANAPIWLPIHTELEGIAKRYRGAVKPTGAGGGDLALAAFCAADDAAAFRRELADRGILCPNLAPSAQGVRLQSQASKVGE